jgi:hypothetical protein
VAGSERKWGTVEGPIGTLAVTTQPGPGPQAEGVFVVDLAIAAQSLWSPGARRSAGWFHDVDATPVEPGERSCVSE